MYDESAALRVVYDECAEPGEDEQRGCYQSGQHANPLRVVKLPANDLSIERLNIK